MTTLKDDRRRGWVVGSINQDIVAYADRIPEPGETVLGRTSALTSGGKGANQAVAMARLGADVALIGRVGRDAFGSSLSSFLAGEGVDVSGVEVVADVATGVALIVVDNDADNAIVVVPGANASWGDGLGGFEPASGDVVSCQLEIPPEIVRDAFRVARARGALSVFNPSPYSEAARPLISDADILIVNEVETMQVLDETDLALDDAALAGAATRLSQLGPSAAIITLGGNGAVVALRGSVEHVKGCPVEAVDTTGAGDCFTGAMIASLLAGLDIIPAVRFAVKAAALSVTRKGAAASYPRRDELDKSGD